MRKRMVRVVELKFRRVNLIRVAKPFIFFNILRAIVPWVVSSWANVFLEFNLRLFFPRSGFNCIYTSTRGTGRSMTGAFYTNSSSLFRNDEHYI